MMIERMNQYIILFVVVSFSCLQSTYSSTKEDLVDVSLSSSAIIDASIEQIWSIQSNFTHMHEWYHQFSGINIIKGDGHSVGSQRECIVSNNASKRVNEELVAFDPSRYTYSYSVLPYKDPSQNPLPFTLVNHRADVRLFPLNCDVTTGASTFVLWSIKFQTLRSSAKLATKVNEQVFGVLFTQLAAYFKNNRIQKGTTDIRHIVGSDGHVRTSFGCALTGNASRVYQELTGRTSMAHDYKPSSDVPKARQQALLNRRMYHFADAHTIGYRFDILEDTLAVNSSDYTSTTTIQWGIASLPELRSVQSHKRSARVYPIVFQTSSRVNLTKADSDYHSVLVFEDEFVTSNSQAPSAIQFIKWLSNSIASHIEHTVTSPSDDSKGKLVRRVCTQTFSAPSDVLWTGLDDYVAVMKVFSDHDDLELDPNDPTVISFLQPGFTVRTYEKLTIKQNSPPIRTWQIILPVANAVFDQYTATVHWSDTLDKNNRPSTHSTMVFEMKFKGSTPSGRAQFIDMAEYYISVRAQQIASLAARQLGKLHPYDAFELDYPADDYYKVLSTWADTTWVQASQGSYVNRQGLSRFVNWANGALMRESMIDHNDKARTLTYMVEPSDNMLCGVYAADIRVEPLDGGKRCKVYYTSILLPLGDKKMDEVEKFAVGTLTPRFAWMQKTFIKKAAEVQRDL